MIRLGCCLEGLWWMHTALKRSVLTKSMGLRRHLPVASPRRGGEESALTLSRSLYRQCSTAEVFPAYACQ